MRRLLFAYAVLFSLAIASFAWLGTNSRMVADDYCTAAEARELGAWGSVVMRYERWSGLYANFFIKGAVEPLQPGVHAWLPAIFMFGLIAALRLLLLQLGGSVLRLSADGVGIAALALAFFILNAAPSRQNLYWSAAIIPYSLPLPVLLTLIAYVTWFARQARPAILTVASAALLGSLTFVLGGMSEIVATGQVVGWGIFLLSLMMTRSPRHDLWALALVGLFAASAAFIVVAAAPGNFVRQQVVIERFGDTRPSLLGFVERLVTFTVSLFFIETYGLANQGAAFLGAIALAFCLHRPGDARRAWVEAWQGRPVGRWALLAGLLALLMVAAALAPSLYATGNVSSRTLMSSRLLLTLLFAWWGWLAAVAMARRGFPGLKRARRPVYRLVALSVGLLMVFMPLYALVYNGSYIDRFAAYARDWEARHALLTASAGQEEVQLTPLAWSLDDYLELERIDPPSGEPSGMTFCAARYYGIGRLLIDSSGF
ncbi:MAG: DUF6056 family protein [Anaerolineae bacterium]|nr:DUF6056 family protein [Anaerolineae bacterium]MDW8172866.1 DUF6056 family protein [Anaerolineae bacterium]